MVLSHPLTICITECLYLSLLELISSEKDEDEYDIYDIGLNNEGVYNAISYIRKFYDRGAFPSSLLGYYGRHAINDLFTNRKAAACITGVWQIIPFISSGVNFGVSLCLHCQMASICLPSWVCVVLLFPSGQSTSLRQLSLQNSSIRQSMPSSALKRPMNCLL